MISTRKRTSKPYVVLTTTKGTIIDVDFAYGEGMKPLAREAIRLRLYQQGSGFINSFMDILENYTKKEMGKHILAIAYIRLPNGEGSVHAATVHAAEDYLGVYVRPIYRRQGIGSVLIRHFKDYAPCPKYQTSNPGSKTFFRKNGVPDFWDFRS